MTSGRRQPDTVNRLSPDISHRLVKAESVMKAQAWVSDINMLHSSVNGTSCIGSSQQIPPPSAGPSADSQLMTTWLRPVVYSAVPSLKTPTGTTASSLPPNLSRAAVFEGVSQPHSLTIDYLAFGTPMKRVDSISASVGHHTNTSAVSLRNPSTTQRLYHENDTAETTAHAGNQYTKRHDFVPQVQATVDHRSNEPSHTATTGFKTVHQQTSDAGDVPSNLPSAASETVALSPVISSHLPSLLATVSYPSSTSESTSAASLLVDAGSVQSPKPSTESLLTSHRSTRLNELWNRFNEDQSVYSPHPTDMGTVVSSGSSLQHTVDSNTLWSTRQHPKQSVVRLAEDRSHGTQKQQQSLSGRLVSRNILGDSSSDAGITVNAAETSHHHSSSDTEHILQHRSEPLHSLRNVNSDVENKTKTGRLSMSDDARKEPPLSASVPVKHAWIVRDETLPVVPEDTTLDSLASDFMSTSSVDDMGNVIVHTTKRQLPNDPKLLRLQQKIAQQREKHRKVHRNEQRRKEHIVKMELAIRERQRVMEQEKTKNDLHPSASQLETTTSSTTLGTTVTSNDSEITLYYSSSQPDGHHYNDDSQFLDTSGRCTCQQTECKIHRVINGKVYDKSTTTFKPKLREVKYTRSKSSKSSPVKLSKEVFPHEQEKSAVTKTVRRTLIPTSVSHRSRIPQTTALKNSRGDRRTPSKIIQSSKIGKLTAVASPSKANHVLTEKSRRMIAERDVQSKGVQTTPRLRDIQVSYASTAVQCPADSSRFDELGVISIPTAGRTRPLRSLSSKVFSPPSSTNAELMLHSLKSKSVVNQPVRVPLPRELFACNQ